MKKWLVMACLLYALPLLAQTYEWTDEHGNVNFTDDLGNVPKKFRKKARPVGSDEGAPPASAAPDASQAKPAPEKKGEKEKKTLYGGKDEKGWKGEFGRLKADIAATEKDLDDLRTRLADTSKMSRGEYVTLQNTQKQAEHRLQQLDGKMQELRERADREGVPAEWRE